MRVSSNQSISFSVHYVLQKSGFGLRRYVVLKYKFEISPFNNTQDTSLLCTSVQCVTCRVQKEIRMVMRIHPPFFRGGAGGGGRSIFASLSLFPPFCELLCKERSPISRSRAEGQTVGLFATMRDKCDRGERRERKGGREGDTVHNGNSAAPVTTTTTTKAGSAEVRVIWDLTHKKSHIRHARVCFGVCYVTYRKVRTLCGIVASQTKVTPVVVPLDPTQSTQRKREEEADLVYQLASVLCSYHE